MEEKIKGGIARAQGARDQLAKEIQELQAKQTQLERARQEMLVELMRLDGELRGLKALLEEKI